jgi:DNA-binding IclR family transcriptional regulator
VLLNGLKVLETFSIEEPLLGVTEIAGRVGMHKSSVSRILAVLEQVHYVERDPESGRFRLGLGVIGLAGPLLADLDVRRAAHPALERLSQRTGETAALLVWNGTETVVVEQVASTHQVKHTAAIGTRYDSADSASVQVFLAALPAGEVLRLFDRRVLTGAHDPDSVAEYQQILQTVRQQGYAVNDGRTSAEEVGLAAPVHDHRGETVAAVLLSAPRFRITTQMLEPLARTVADAGREIAVRLGYRSDTATS